MQVRCWRVRDLNTYRRITPEYQVRRNHIEIRPIDYYYSPIASSDPKCHPNRSAVEASQRHRGTRRLPEIDNFRNRVRNSRLIPVRLATPRVVPFRYDGKSYLVVTLYGVFAAKLPAPPTFRLTRATPP
jgi:hypothetical protein